jgi:DNA-binding NtrC family response regulator
MLVCETTAIGIEHIDFAATSTAAETAGPSDARATSNTQHPKGKAGDPSKAAEREQILAALQACNGNQKEAARALGITRRVLIYRLDKLGLPRPRKRSD